MAFRSPNGLSSSSSSSSPSESVSESVSLSSKIPFIFCFCAADDEADGRTGKLIGRGGRGGLGGLTTRPAKLSFVSSGSRGDQPGARTS